MGLTRQSRREALGPLLGEGRSLMNIIDGQMHDPAPWLDWTDSDPGTQHNLQAEIMLGYLDACGVNGVLMFTSEDSGPAVARACPSRVAYVPGIRPDVPDIDAAVASAKASRKDGLVALRAVIGWPLDGSEVKRLRRRRMGAGLPRM
jgi:hypothetical protein